jgi:hypothetical protein
MEKTKTILRWIFFAPLAFGAGALFVLLTRLSSPIDDSILGQIWIPIIWNIVFFVVAHTVIPSSLEKKAIIPLIILFMLNVFGLTIMFFNMFVGIYEVNHENICNSIGNIISFCFICYYLFFESGRETIKNIL